MREYGDFGKRHERKTAAILACSTRRRGGVPAGEDEAGRKFRDGCVGTRGERVVAGAVEAWSECRKELETAAGGGSSGACG